MTNTRHTEDAMTSYELFAAERTTTIRIRAAEGEWRAARLREVASGHRPETLLRAISRRLHLRPNAQPTRLTST
jgi:hypothetical protein